MTRRLNVDWARIRRAHRRMADAEAGIPSTGADSGRGHGRDGSAVEAAALRHQVDHAAQDRAALLALLATITDRHRQALPWLQEAERLERLLDQWDPPAAVLAALRDMAGDGEPGCQSCARVGAWNPIHGGGMCRFCDRLLARVRGVAPQWAQAHPPVGLVERHRQGKVVDQATIERHMGVT